MKLLYCLALFGTVYSLTFSQLYLETLAAVTRCNNELNSTATVYIQDDSRVLVQLLQNDMTTDSYDAIVDEYFDCMHSNNSLPMVTIFGDDENVFSTAHECTLTSYLDLVERSEFDDLELVVPLRPNLLHSFHEYFRMKSDTVEKPETRCRVQVDTPRIH